MQFNAYEQRCCELFSIASNGLIPYKTKGSEVNLSFFEMVQEEGLEPPTASV